MDADSRLYVAGSRTMIGAALVRRLAAAGLPVVGADDEEPDLTNRGAVDHFFEDARPTHVFVAAGRTAGIGGNLAFPADLMLDNLLVGTHVIPAAWRAGVQKLLYLSSSCTYPKHAPSPWAPSSLWTGPVEPTSAAYAVAKLAGVELCRAYRRQHDAPFITAIGADAYGPGDDFSEAQSHVVGALIRRMHRATLEHAPVVEVWGSGTPRREFIYVDDLAEACLFAMRQYDEPEPINLGTGADASIAQLAAAVRDVVGFEGELRFDRSKPDGLPLKSLDSSVLRDLGWGPRWSLRDGLAETYRWYLAEQTG